MSSSPKLHHKSSLSYQASSPKSKMFALNTQIHNAKNSNNDLRQAIKQAKHKLLRTQTTIDSVNSNCDSLHRFNQRTTAKKLLYTTKSSISSKKCTTLQHKIEELQKDTSAVNRLNATVRRNISHEEEAGRRLKRLSVGVRAALVKSARSLATKKQLLSSLEHQEKGSTAKLNNRQNTTQHHVQAIQTVLKEIEQLSMAD